MISQDWREVKLGEIIKLSYGKGLPKRKRESGPYPVIGSGGIIDYNNSYLIEGPGIIVGRKGSIGTVYFERQNYWPIDTVFFVELLNNGTDFKFIYYLLLQSNLSDLNSDAAVPGLNRNIAHSQVVKIPPKHIQIKIANLITRHDDLIEKNERRIQILEEMAQLIYREWFVYYRFPGHEHVKMVDSGTEFGEIPEGWKAKRLGDISDLSWGDTNVTKSSYGEDGYDAYSASGLDGKLSYYDYDREGVVLSAIGANCGKTWFATGKWSCIKNTIRFWSVTPAVSNEYLFLATNKIDFWPRRGAAQPFISQGDARSINILVPNGNVDSNFANIIRPKFQLANNLERKNLLLRKQRDLLLPKLVSGEVDVSELDIKIA